MQSKGENNNLSMAWSEKAKQIIFKLKGKQDNSLPSHRQGDLKSKGEKQWNVR